MDRQNFSSFYRPLSLTGALHYGLNLFQIDTCDSLVHCHFLTHKQASSGVEWSAFEQNGVQQNGAGGVSG